MPKITPVNFKRLISIFEQEGFIHSRTSGDHLVYTKHNIKRPLVIPAYSEVPVFIIKNLIKTAEISRERYFELLK